MAQPKRIGRDDPASLLTPWGPLEQQQRAIALKDALISKFSDEELQVVAFDLGIEYDDLPGDSRPTKVIALVRHAQRSGLVTRLQSIIDMQRPPNAES